MKQKELEETQMHANFTLDRDNTKLTVSFLVDAAHDCFLRCKIFKAQVHLQGLHGLEQLIGMSNWQIQSFVLQHIDDTFANIISNKP